MIICICQEMSRNILMKLKDLYAKQDEMKKKELFTNFFTQYLGEERGKAFRMDIWIEDTFEERVIGHGKSAAALTKK